MAQNQGDDALMDEPLPAPTGPNLAMFLERPRAQQAPPPAAAAARPAAPPAAAAAPKAPTPAADPAVQVQPEAQQQRQPPRQQQAPAAPAPAQAAAADKQDGMSRLDLETCLAMHSILAKYKEADPFRQPVDVEGLNIPDYYDIIKKPMDLKTARDKLRAGRYKSLQEWRADIQQIWDNAYKYNGEDHPVSSLARKLQIAVDRRMDDAVATAKANIEAAAQGQPRPRKSIKRSELSAPYSSAPPSSESESEEEPEAAGRRSPEVPRVKRERELDAAAGRAPKRSRQPSSAAAAAAGGGASAGSNAGLDLDTLTSMLNTPIARQMGAEEPDDLAFLALWKRLMTRKQQLTASAASSGHLRASLSSAHETIRTLRDESRAWVLEKAALEDQVAGLKKDVEHWKNEYQQQQGIIDAQRDLLEQQQAVLRKLAAQKQAQAQGDEGGQ